MKGEYPMSRTDVWKQVSRKGFDAGKLAAKAADDPRLLARLLAGLESEAVRVKYGCEKVLRRISETRPKSLYPHIDLFIGLLDGDNTILKWGAILILGHLAAVDADGKIDRILDRYLAPIKGPVMITAANTLAGAARIAGAKPQFAGRIAEAFLWVETAEYKTPECRNIALGHAVKALEEFYDRIPEKQPVLDFVRRRIKNSRNATRKKAERFLRKHNAEG
jgi:hypothetical protein